MPARSRDPARRTLVAAALLVASIAQSGRPTTAAPERAPRIVEFGATFHSPLGYGLAVAADGSAWALEEDGIAHVYPDGRIVQTRRGRECNFCYPYPGVAVSPDGSAYAAFVDEQQGAHADETFDALVRFVDGRATVARAVPNAGSVIAATAGALLAAHTRERGLSRIDASGNVVKLMTNAGYAKKIAVGADDTVWTLTVDRPDRNYQPQEPTAAAFSSSTSDTSDVARSYVTSHTLDTLAVAPDGSLLAQSRPADESDYSKPTALVRIRPDGSVTTLEEARKASTGYDPIGGIAVASNGAVWYSEPGRNRIVRLDPDGTTHVVRDGIPNGAAPLDIALAPDGAVWFTDPGRYTVERVGPDGTVRVFGNGLRPDAVPNGPVVTSDGAVWYYESLTWHARIVRIDPSGAVREFRVPENEWVSSLQRFGTDVVTLDSSTGARPKLRVFHPDGSRDDRDASPCLDGKKSFACFATRVRRPLKSPLGLPDAAVLGPDGAIWFTDSARGAIGRVTPSGTFTFFTRGLTRGRSFPRYIVRGPHDTLWFTEIGDRIGRITLDGRITEFTAGIPVRASIGGIVAGRDGNLWFTLYHGNELARITPNGIVSRFRAGIYPSRGNNDEVDSVPTVDALGRIWFNEPQGGRIARATLP